MKKYKYPIEKAYIARKHRNGVTKYLGVFETPEEAFNAYRSF